MMILLPILVLLVFLALSICYVFGRIARQARHLDALQQTMATRKAKEAVEQGKGCPLTLILVFIGWGLGTIGILYPSGAIK